METQREVSVVNILERCATEFQSLICEFKDGLPCHMGGDELRARIYQWVSLARHANKAARNSVNAVDLSLLKALEQAELSTTQMRIAADIGRKSAKDKVQWYERQLKQLGCELRAAITKAGQLPFNLYAKRSYGDPRQTWTTTETPTGRWYDLIMPDDDGVMRSDRPKGWAWFGIVWPVNPHDTGRRGILEMLNRLIPPGQAIGQQENQHGHDEGHDTRQRDHQD